MPLPSLPGRLLSLSHLTLSRMQPGRTSFAHWLPQLRTHWDPLCGVPPRPPPPTPRAGLSTPGISLECRLCW